MLNREQVIERLCEISAKLNNDYFGYSVATDCFCGKKYSFDFRFEEEVIDFIEESVKLRIEYLLANNKQEKRND